MHFRIQAIKRIEGVRFTAQVVITKKEIYSVGTFDSNERAAIAAKIFIYFYARFPEEVKERRKNYF